MEILYEEHCRIKVPSSKNFVILLNSASILVEKYHKDAEKIEKILKALKDIGKEAMKEIKANGSL
jgi:hypothetical protein